MEATAESGTVIIFKKRAYYEHESPYIAMIIPALVRTNSTASEQQSSAAVHLLASRRETERGEPQALRCLKPLTIAKASV